MCTSHPLAKQPRVVRDELRRYFEEIFDRQIWFRGSAVVRFSLKSIAIGEKLEIGHAGHSGSLKKIKLQCLTKR